MNINQKKTALVAIIQGKLPTWTIYSEEDQIIDEYPCVVIYPEHMNVVATNTSQVVPISHAFTVMTIVRKDDQTTAALAEAAAIGAFDAFMDNIGVVEIDRIHNSWMPVNGVDCYSVFSTLTVRN